MKSALFTNYSDEAFTGFYNGKGKTVEPGDSWPCPDYIARNFAKKLANRELQRVKRDKDGEIVRDSDGRPVRVIRDGEKYTSPKFPEQVPIFQELFDKAYSEEQDEELSQTSDDPMVTAEVSQKRREAAAKVEPKPEAPPAEPQGQKDPESFEGKPSKDE